MHPSTCFTILLLLNLICFSLNNNCCNNSQCDFCICDPTNNISSCAIQISETPVTYNVNNSITYLYFTPSQTNYKTIYFFFQGQNIFGGYNGLRYIIESGNGGQYPNSSNSNITYFNATNDWSQFYMLRAVFPQLNNGELAKLIFSITLDGSNSTNETMQTFIQVKYRFDYWPIIVICFSILILMVISFLAMYLKKRCMQLREQAIKRKQIQSMEIYLPKLKFETLNYNLIMNCSICLCDITNQEIVRQTPCDHIFHANCIDDWCKKSQTCPICRESLQISQLQKNSKIKEKRNLTQDSKASMMRTSLLQKKEKRDVNQILNEQL